MRSHGKVSEKKGGEGGGGEKKREKTTFSSLLVLSSINEKYQNMSEKPFLKKLSCDH